MKQRKMPIKKTDKLERTRNVSQKKGRTCKNWWGTAAGS